MKMDLELENEMMRLLDHAFKQYRRAATVDEMNYWQGCKDAIRRVMALSSNRDEGWLEIIKSSAFSHRHDTIADTYKPEGE